MDLLLIDAWNIIHLSYFEEERYINIYYYCFKFGWRGYSILLLLYCYLTCTPILQWKWNGTIHVPIRFHCWISRTYSGAFWYADDLALLASSLGSLQKIIRICEQYTEVRGSYCLCSNLPTDSGEVVSNEKTQIIMTYVSKKIRRTLKTSVIILNNCVYISRIHFDLDTYIDKLRQHKIL